MKKYFYSVLAAGMLFATSCSQDQEIVDITKGEGQQVTFKVQIPEANESRAIKVGDNENVEIGKGQLATRLIYAQFEAGTTDTAAEPLVIGIVDDAASGETPDKSFTVNLTMAKDLTYDFLFMAYNPDNNIFGIPSTLDKESSKEAIIGAGVDLRNLKLKNELLANQEAYDAFVYALKNQGINSEDRTVPLKRPFAQVNAVTTKADLDAAKQLGITVTHSQLKIDAPTAYNIYTGKAGTQDPDVYVEEITYQIADIFKKSPAVTEGHVNEKFDNTDDQYYLTSVYVLTDATETSSSSTNNAVLKFYRGENEGSDCVSTINIPSLPLQRNYRTNVIGNLITKTEDYTIEIKEGFDGGVDVENGSTIKYANVDSPKELQDALENPEFDVIVLEGDINLNDLMSRAEADDPSLLIKSGRTLAIDLNGKTLSATSSQTGKNYNMFDVRGTLTVKNGTMEYEHKGENMGWNSSTNLFNVTAGGVLNLEGVTAKNLGGSDMGFVAHLNNWGVVTLNVDNCTLESNYVPVRVFNSGPDMNNVTIKNSTLKGVSAAFWVHNYTAVDFGTEAKAEAQKALLNFEIYNQGNTFSPDLNGIRYGFTNSVRADAYGITKSVSEDGTVVTLGSMTEDGLIRRGVAGTEENTTITKVVVGEGVTTLYDRTFRRFYALETVELPSTLTTIGAEGTGVFQSCTNLKNIVLPESVTVLGKGSFQECSSLESINIPAGVTRIESDALRATGLKSVEFHAGVTYFGAQAFRDCKQLTEVIINAPKFTIEANAFGVMSGTLPGTTIYVANAEMEAYLESTLSYKNQLTIIAGSEVNNNESLKDALDGDAKIINVAAGEYEFPATSVKAGQTINCAEGTVFTGKSSLNVKGATIVGATFKNEGGEAVSGTVYGTFKDCTFEGYETLRWCYTTAGESVVFENCVVKTTKRGIHFDVMDGDVTFKNCEINGFNAYSGAGTMTFDNCTFGHDQSKYNGLNIYTNTVLKNCTFNFVSGNTNFIDMEGTGKTLTIENCTATLDGAAANINDFVGGSKLNENTVTIDGATFNK